VRLADLPVEFLAIGRFSYVCDKNTLVQSLSGEGQLIDICEALE
jgi:hypothetical protein